MDEFHYEKGRLFCVRCDDYASVCGHKPKDETMINKDTTVWSKERYREEYLAACNNLDAAEAHNIALRRQAIEDGVEIVGLRAERDDYKRRLFEAEDRIDARTKTIEKLQSQLVIFKTQHDEIVKQRDGFVQGCEFRGSILTAAREAVNIQGDYLHDADGDLVKAITMLGNDLRYNIEQRAKLESQITSSNDNLKSS